MLSAIDELLRSALRAVFPADTEVSAGPVVVPLSPDKTGISVCAIALRLPTADNTHEPAEAREAAYATQRFNVSPTRAKPREVTLPAAAKGQVAEVQLSSGRVLRAGDGYTADGRKVQFYQPPAGAVTVRTRGDATRGYREVSACEVDIELNAWAADAVTADGLLMTALVNTLAQFAERDAIDLAGVDAGSGIRILKPLARLSSLSRAQESVGDKSWVRSTARVALRGELEMLLALGTAEPEGVIERIEAAIASGAPETQPFTFERDKP